MFNRLFYRFFDRFFDRLFNRLFIWLFDGLFNWLLNNYPNIDDGSVTTSNNNYEINATERTTATTAQSVRKRKID